MSPKNTTTELDPEALATLRQARATAAQLRNMGIQVQPLEPMPLKAEKPNIVRSEKTESYENFIEIQNLPSKGLFYHNKLHGQGLKMEDIIQIQTMDDYTLIPNFTEIFTRRLRGVDAEHILTGDELYIALWLRASSFPNSNNYSDGFICSNDKCNFTVVDPDYGVPFNQITFSSDAMPDDLFKLHQENGYVEDVLPDSNKIIQVELRRRYHSRLIADLLQADFYGEDISNETYQVQINLLKIASVVNIDGIKLDGIESLKERVKIIKDLSPMDSLKLIKTINKNSFIPEPILNHICPKCGKVTETRGYPFRIETYIPNTY